MGMGATGVTAMLDSPLPEPLDAMNSTGVLIAVIDGANYIPVCPVNPLEMKNWIQSRPIAKENPYYLTKILMGISVKNNGSVCDVTGD